MNNTFIKRWLAPVSLVLVTVTVVSLSMVFQRNSRLDASNSQISALQEQVSALSEKVGSLSSAVSNLGYSGSGIPEAVSSVIDGVVSINTTYKYTSSIWGWGGGSQTYTEEGAGTGWIVDSSGIIVTNYHVVEDADSVSVTLANGDVYNVTDKIYYDANADIAVFKIDADAPLTALTIGDSSGLEVGDWVVAVGNALNMGISSTEGIVSQLGISLTIENVEYSGLIGTSAAINSGNSGGVLINMQGEVVGITNAKVADVGVEGMGYAMNIDDSMVVINRLIAQM
jgi:S1-C subfamily serine protease